MLHTALGRDCGRLKQLLYLINLKCKQRKAQGRSSCSLVVGMEELRGQAEIKQLQKYQSVL